MSSNSFFYKFFDKIDLIIAFILLITGLFFSFFQLIKNSSPSVPILFIIFSILYVIFRNEKLDINSIQLKFKYYKLNEIFFVICFISFIGLFYLFNYPFPLVNLLLLATLIGLSILISIFTKSNNSWTILIKIILLTVLIRASIFYAFPVPYGVDPTFHIVFAQNIANSGHLPLTDESYSYYPLYHIILALLNELTKLSFYNLSFIIGIIQLTIVFPVIFIIGKKVCNEEIALLAVFIFGISGSVIMGYLIPNMFGLAIFALLFYIIFNQRNIIFASLFLICSLSLNLIHPYPAINLILMMLTLFITIKFMDYLQIDYSYKSVYIKLESILIVIVLFLTNALVWGYNPFLRTAILNSFAKEKSFDISGSVANLSLVNVYNDLNYIFLGLAIFSSLYWISSKKRDGNKIFLGFLTLVMIGVYVAIYGLGLSFIPLPYRMLPFLFIPISILAAQAIFYIHNILNNRISNGKGITIFIIILITSLSFVSFTSVNVYPDFELYHGELGYTNSLSTSEIAVLPFLGNFTNSNANYDGYYKQYILNANISAPYPSDNSQKVNMMVLRKYFLENSYLRGLSNFPKINGTISQNKYESIEGIENWNIIYNNGGLWVYDK
ncbi:hypothetical protein Metbo_0858 [Methanobacterium lacus]|uniref:Glycosyltransferase RgtA/B/C/D-like domain-containing protein n=1 Tax=Methanobacterium lacus (strain AL-21) TaxID=877455 RepID=F0TBN1_METLA|nr:hypothetical protein [Methanobacterium lacus]ADZ09108.1 hypothetical protein Metbo_0858 [Methanobacterium lacus]